MPANIVIRIGAESGQAVSEIGKVNKALGEQMSTSQKAHAAITKAAVPAALALTAIAAAAGDAVKAAAEDQASQAKLAGTLERTTGATTAQVAATEDWITKTEFATGVADDQLRPALGRLATATGDVHQAQKALGIALDVSAQTGKSLDSVSAAIAKGYTGQTGALNKLVPGMDQAVLKSKDMTKVLGELSDMTGGAAAEHAQTLAGQTEILGVKMAELKETLGAALLPVLEKFMPLMQKGADFVSAHAGAIEALVGAVAGLAAIIITANAALKAYQALQVLVKVATTLWTAAQWLLNAALDANPIGLVTLAVAGLVAGIIIAYNKSETFRNIVQSAMGAVKAAIDAVASAFKALLSAATSAFDWIVAHWKVALFALGPVGAAISLIASNFDAITGAARAAWAFIKNNFTKADFAFGPIEDAVNAIAGAFNAVLGAVTAAIGAVQSLIGWLSKIHVPSIHIPNPFGLSAPLPGAAIAGGRARGVASGVGRAAPAATGVVINVSGAIDPEGTARAIERVLRNHERRLGLAW